MPRGNRIKILFAASLVLIISGYALSKSLLFIEGPELTISSPSEGMVSKEELLPIVGEAKNIAFLSLNGRQIYTDEAGRLYDELLLFPGYNVITVSASDRFGRKKEIVRHVIYKPSI